MDRSVAYVMPKALANRLCHIEIAADHKSWHDWAVGAGINAMVLGFLNNNPSLLMKFDTVTDNLAFPTPRSWVPVFFCQKCFESSQRYRKEYMKIIRHVVNKLTCYRLGGILYKLTFYG